MNVLQSQKIPVFLYEKLLKQYNNELTNEIISGYIKKKTTIRINSLKTDINSVMQELNNNKITYQTLPWFENALVLDECLEKQLEELKIYKEGYIYLQNLSSMIPPLVLNPQANEIILDMAAAPGSKTTQLATLSNNKALITACEKNKNRAERLKYNIEKQGAKKINVLVKDSKTLDDYLKFEKILLDAPCSGSGTIDLNNPKLSEIFTEDLIMRSAKTQLALLKKATNLLSSKGEIIYSTCSILKEENEDIINEILKDESIELVSLSEDMFKDIPLLPVSIKGTICIKPTAYYEGFFIAKLKKKK